MSSYHIGPDTAEAYVAAIRAYRLKYLIGYASALASLAHYIVERDISPPRLSLVLSNAEPLYEHQRMLISSAFSADVRDSYGMSEIVVGASECHAGVLHLWPDAGFYEVLRDDTDEPVSPGEAGRLICTGLLNCAMPLIRYETGDRVRITHSPSQCACGRTLPILSSVEGRIDDVIVTPTGVRVGRLSPVFKGFPIIEAQVEQVSGTELVLRVVPDRGFGAKEELGLVHALQARVGSMNVSIHRCGSIPRSSNGKFKVITSSLKRQPHPRL